MGPPLLMGLECVLLGLWVHSFPTMLVSCCFFGLGNGLLIGSSLNYVYELAPAHLKSQRPGPFFAAVSSVAGILGNLTGGVVYDAVGARPFYLLVAAVFALSFAVFFLTQRKRTASSHS